jgi:hypothetical protein
MSEIRLKRVFKSGWFAKAARKARIKDSELCDAIEQVIQGQSVDLGGGVFKKRLNENRHRSIILSKSGRYWIYEFLFAKKDLDNISDEELSNFRKLAKAYSELSKNQVEQLLRNKDLVEICDECKK